MQFTRLISNSAYGLCQKIFLNYNFKINFEKNSIICSSDSQPFLYRALLWQSLVTLRSGSQTRDGEQSLTLIYLKGDKNNITRKVWMLKT